MKKDISRDQARSLMELIDRYNKDYLHSSMPRYLILSFNYIGASYGLQLMLFDSSESNISHMHIIKYNVR